MNEKNHAWIIAAFYRHFLVLSPEHGRAVFLKAAQRYGEERGRRMALRALRDGQPLNYVSYMAYKEWQPSDPNFFAGSIVSYAPDYETHNYRCPWSDTFVAVGQDECGTLYCHEIDAALVRGFNPELNYELLNPLIGHDCCRMIFKNAHLAEGQIPSPKSVDTIRSFSYHCGHLFHVFSETAQRVFDRQGMEITLCVLREFQDEFGLANAAELQSAALADFDKI